MSRADYLAQKYLTADPPADKKSKKRKRKAKETPGLVIADDDVSGWNAAVVDDNDDDLPVVLGDSSLIDAVKRKKAAARSKGPWRTFGVAAPTNAQQLAADGAKEKEAADAILASAAADRAAAEEADEGVPQVVDPENELRMASGARAGLQTGAEVAAAVAEKQAEERRQAAEAARDQPNANETIFRDASGRIINVQMKRAEQRRKAEEQEQLERDRARAARGDVQRAQADERARALRDAKLMPVARYASDEAFNDELKAQTRWNDPAARLLKSKEAAQSVTGKPLYQGGAAPNRYGIRPGHRWDGVDRGNGFESKWFKARNNQTSREQLDYAWQMDE